MFEFIKKQKEMAVYAPMDGVAIKLSDVPDDAFAEKILDYMGERGVGSRRHMLTENGAKDWNELLKSGKLSAPAVPSNDSMHENLDELLDDPDGELPF